MTKSTPSFEERQAWYREPVRHVNARDRRRTVPLQVLNLGMVRTGTMSIQHALDILGIPCYHGAVLLTRPSDVPLWSEALKAKFHKQGQPYGREEFDRLVGEFGALSDVPAICFVEELVAAYPEAKVILTERDMETWQESFRGVADACFRQSTHWIASLDRWWLGPLRNMTMIWVNDWFGAHSRDGMLEKAVPKYQEHYALVRNVTPPERLLEYRLGSGWEPLCTFLGKPIPDVPFPHANDQKGLREMTGLISKRGTINVVKAVVAVVLPVAVAVVVSRQYFGRKLDRDIFSFLGFS